MRNKNNAPASIELDVTTDGLVDPEFIAFLENNNILFRVVTWQGPGGGFPVLEFSGKRESLEKMLRTVYTSGDKEQDDYMVSLIY